MWRRGKRAQAMATVGADFGNVRVRAIEHLRTNQGPDVARLSGLAADAGFGLAFRRRRRWRLDQIRGRRFRRSARILLRARQTCLQTGDSGAQGVNLRLQTLAADAAGLPCHEERLYALPLHIATRLNAYQISSSRLQI